jgi:hypothetical protein
VRLIRVDDIDCPLVDPEGVSLSTLGHWLCLWAYHCFALSLRDVEDLLAERGITVSHEIIKGWVAKFGTQIAAKIQREYPQSAEKWHLDEVVITICGKTHWLGLRSMAIETRSKSLCSRAETLKPPSGSCGNSSMIFSVRYTRPLWVRSAILITEPASQTEAFMLGAAILCYIITGSYKLPFIVAGNRLVIVGYDTVKNLGLFVEKQRVNWDLI